jgi:hypothetical protein
MNAYGSGRKAKMSSEKGKKGFILFLVTKNLGLENVPLRFQCCAPYYPDPDLIKVQLGQWTKEGQNR